MNPQLDKMTLLNVAAGLEQCGNKEKEYTERILRYYEEEQWGELQAYFEVRDWKRYLLMLENLEMSSRGIGAEKLAAAVTRLVIAAREKNEWGIDCSALATAIGERAVAFPTPEVASLYLRGRVKDGDTVVVLGAGDVADRFFVGELAFGMGES